ncbi:hypothetical protein [Streptomyces cavernae]|uniref:hypothetical protein n=1 Tax=Streptomyces cavernae TaxID=2259034 RepID=UPI000FEB911E|nr:hypothetical protein [Streptomyces cavernae]
MDRVQRDLGGGVADPVDQRVVAVGVGVAHLVRYGTGGVVHDGRGPEGGEPFHVVGGTGATTVTLRVASSWTAYRPTRPRGLVEREDDPDDARNLAR